MGLKTLRILDCPICHKRFETYHPQKAYCSEVCQVEGRKRATAKRRAEAPEYYRSKDRERQEKHSRTVTEKLMHKPTPRTRLYSILGEDFPKGNIFDSGSLADMLYDRSIEPTTMVRLLTPVPGDPAVCAVGDLGLERTSGRR